MSRIEILLIFFLRSMKIKKLIQITSDLTAVLVLFCCMQISYAEKIYFYEDEPILGKIEKITKEGILIFREEKNGLKKEIPVDDISRIESSACAKSEDPENSAILHLWNGDKLYVSDPSFKEKRIKALLALNEISIPLECVKMMIFSTETAENDYRNFEKEDAIYLTNNDRALGEITGLSGGKIRFKSSFGELSKDLKNEKNEQMISAVTFKKASANFCPHDKQFVSIESIDSGRVTGEFIRHDGNTIFIDTKYSGKIGFKKEFVKTVFLKGGNSVYLSDLNHFSVKEEPFIKEEKEELNTVFHYKNDLNCHGKQISIAGKTYDKGLGTHSRCTLVYDIPGKFSFFRAEIGIDDIAGAKKDSITGENFGAVLFKVMIEENEVFSGKMNGGEKALKIDIPIKEGAKKITLLSDFVPEKEKNMVGCLADWANARFCKK